MIKRIADVVRSGKRFLITSHVRLDGDALGSELALFLALRAMGKEAVIYNQDEAPRRYAFLPGFEAVSHTLDTIEGFDALFLLDCSDFQRIGDQWKRVASMETIVNIDHHISNDFFSDLSLVDVEASSTGEILYRLMVDMEVAITGDVAVNLYTAILTDTGSFRYSNTTASTLAVASDLVRAGADPRWVAEHVYESKTTAQVALLRDALGTLEIHEDMRTGIMSVSRRMMADTGAMPEHTDGFVDIVRSLEIVDVAVLLQETSENYYKISFRSKGELNVERVAASFGGGGHVNASACRIAGDGAAVKKAVLDALQALLV